MGISQNILYLFMIRVEGLKRQSVYITYLTQNI